MSKKMQLDTRESVRVVTTNDFITACGLENISLKARKLLYIAISQCTRTDEEFYEYEISAKKFAELMNVSPTHVYEEADKITDELMRGFIRIATTKSKKSFRKYSLFNKCEYSEEAVLRFKLNKDMTDFLLELKGSFTQPLLHDFLHMNSPYSMAIWHLMQREMRSKKAYGNKVIEFDLSLEELRQVTGTTDKLKQLVHFKERVLDKALREIKDNCGVKITYTNTKSNRTVTGFHFTAVSPHYITPDRISKDTQDKVDLIELKKKAKVRELTPEEQEEYERLIVNAEQISF